MSIENGERLIRMIRKDQKLAEQVAAAGPADFEDVTAAAGASATPYDVIAALVRELHGSTATG